MQHFTNETIDINQLPKYEEIKLTSPDQKYWNVIVINVCIFFLIFGLALLLLVLFKKDFKQFPIQIGLGFLIILGLTFIIYKASFKKRGYALREKDVIYKSGLIAETTTIIPLNRIQHVALDEGFISRFYNLATLEIQTAGGASGHMQIAGIPIENAKIIKEALIKRIDLLENTIISS